MSRQTFTAGQESYRESFNSLFDQELLYHADLKLLAVFCHLKSEVSMVQSLILVYLSVITRPVCIPLTTTKTCMATMKILQLHDSQHIAVIVSSEPFRKPVWKLQA